MARIVSILSAAVTLLLVGCAQADLHYVCKTVGTVLYVVEVNSADAAEGTKLQRFQLSSGFPVLIDTTKYAALHEPSPVGSMWGDGVAYATTMQTRSMWMYMDGTTEAYWDKDTNTGASTWRFKSAPGGVVTETVMRSADCPGSLAVVPPPPTTAAPTNFRLCRRFGDVLYEVLEDQTNTPDGTVLKRYNMSTGSAVLMDTTLYAALALPSPRLSMWGDGVAYASTMQTHFHWMYADPTLEAYWDTVSVSVESTGYEPMFSGRTTTLRINDVLVKTTYWTPLNPQDRGMNVWVLDASMSTVVDTKSYDLHASPAEASALAAYINGLAAGTPVVVAVLDEASFNTNEAAKLALESLGSAKIRQLEWRGAWAIIGRKGAAIGSVPESLDNVGKFVTVSYRVDTWRFHGHGAEPPAMVQLAALRSDECPNLSVE